MKIVFFDGYCSLCNGVVDVLMKLDRRKVLKFASLQGQTAADTLGSLNPSSFDSLIYWQDGERSERSTAVLNLLQDLGGVWKLFGLLKVVPVNWRDGVYRFVARNRYRIFGKRPTCRVPTSEEKEQLLP